MGSVEDEGSWVKLGPGDAQLTAVQATLSLCGVGLMCDTPCTQRGLKSKREVFFPAYMPFTVMLAVVVSIRTVHY